MSNRFKFRAWQKEDQKMLVVVGVSYGININTGCTEIIGIDCAEVTDGRCKFAGGDHDADEVILMQSTGLKDKNGVDIFEDDIVKRISMAVGSHDTVGVVKELEGCWVIDSGNDAIKLWTESDQNEVIGNIHNNPELMEIK